MSKNCASTQKIFRLTMDTGALCVRWILFSPRLPILYDVTEENNGLASCHRDSKTTSAGNISPFQSHSREGLPRTERIDLEWKFENVKKNVCFSF